MVGQPDAAVSQVAENYVRAIYSHTEWQPEQITTSGLAARLGLAPSSVTEMVKKLSASGLVRHIPYGAVSLTDKGRTLALGMVRRHRLIETWLVALHGYSWDEVHDEAEVLEHALSDRLLESIDRELGFPARDPHGDPIPQADLTVPRVRATLLGDATDGAEGVVVRISDRDPALLRHLAASFIDVDTALKVVGRTPFGGDLQLAVGDTEVTIGLDASSAIWISVDATTQPAASESVEAERALPERTDADRAAQTSPRSASRRPQAR